MVDRAVPARLPAQPPQRRAPRHACLLTRLAATAGPAPFHAAPVVYAARMSPRFLPALSIAAGLILSAASPPPGPLPDGLIRALRSRDPLAFADTTLPRLAALDPGQRAALAESLEAWPVPRRVAAWAFLQVGTPYRLGPLGEEAPPDSQPLITF